MDPDFRTTEPCRFISPKESLAFQCSSSARLRRRRLLASHRPRQASGGRYEYPGTCSSTAAEEKLGELLPEADVNLRVGYGEGALDNEGEGTSFISPWKSSTLSSIDS